MDSTRRSRSHLARRRHTNASPAMASDFPRSHCFIYGLALTLVDGNRSAQGDRQLLSRLLPVVVPRGTPLRLYGSHGTHPGYRGSPDHAGPVYSLNLTTAKLGKGRSLLSWLLLLLYVAAVYYVLKCLPYAALMSYYCSRGCTPTVFMLSLNSRRGGLELVCWCRPCSSATR